MDSKWNCPNCGTAMVPHIKRGKDTGNLVCPVCWYKCTPQGERIKANKKIRYKDSLKYDATGGKRKTA